MLAKCPSDPSMRASFVYHNDGDPLAYRDFLPYEGAFKVGDQRQWKSRPDSRENRPARMISAVDSSKGFSE